MREQFSNSWFTVHMAARTRTSSGQSQELETPRGSPMLEQSGYRREPSSVDFPDTSAMEQPELQPSSAVSQTVA